MLINKKVTKFEFDNKLEILCANKQHMQLWYKIISKHCSSKPKHFLFDVSS